MISWCITWFDHYCLPCYAYVSDVLDLATITRMLLQSTPHILLSPFQSHTHCTNMHYLSQHPLRFPAAHELALDFLALAKPVPALGGYSPVSESTPSQVHQFSLGVSSITLAMCLPQPVHDLWSRLVSRWCRSKGIPKLYIRQIGQIEPIHMLNLICLMMYPSKNHRRWK